MKRNKYFWAGRTPGLIIDCGAHATTRGFGARIALFTYVLQISVLWNDLKLLAPRLTRTAPRA